MKTNTPTLIAVDLTKIDDCDHPDIKPKIQYLARIHGKFYAGKFVKEWYGWNFDSVYDAGYQLDWDGWQGLWEIQ